MGLDCYWVLPEDAPGAKNKEAHEALFKDRKNGLDIVGGMLSGHGVGSFRGKVYDAFVVWVTKTDESEGISLYQESIPNEKVLEIATEIDHLAKTRPWKELKEIVPVFDSFETKKQFDDFRLMFRRYADAGARIVGWW